jgi:Heavy metal binding domain
MKKIYFTITLVAALAVNGVASPTTTRDVQQRPAKVRKKVKKGAVGYVCPMHPDMRSKSRGECPKCGMELVGERRSRDRAFVPVH